MNSRTDQEAQAARLHQLLFAKKMVEADFPMDNLRTQWQTLALKPITPDMEKILQELMELAPVATALSSPPGTAANVVAAQQYTQKAGKGFSG